jgi:hypothetical protein
MGIDDKEAVFRRVWWKQRDVELEAVLKKFYHEPLYRKGNRSPFCKNPALEVTLLRTLDRELAATTKDRNWRR